MRGRIWLIGTRHDYHGLGPGSRSEIVERFLSECLAVCVENFIDAVCEEASQDSVSYWCVGGQSPLEIWAAQHGLTYAGIDPSEAECSQLGIPESLEASILKHQGRTAESNQTRLRRSELREREWVLRLKCLSAKNILLVVGSEHVRSLSQKLPSEGFDVQIVHEKWESNS